MDARLLKLPKKRKAGGNSKKDRQIMAHRAKHARYLREDRMNKNKTRRRETSLRREAKLASKRLARQ